MSDEVKREYHIGEYAVGDSRKRKESGVVIIRKRDIEQWSDDWRWIIRWAEGATFLAGFMLAVLVLSMYGVI